MTRAIGTALALLALGVLVGAARAAPEEGEGQGPEAEVAAHAEPHAAAPNPSPLTVDPDLAIFTAIVFLLLLAFLAKFAWRPIIEGLDKREQMIASHIDEAKRSAEKATESLRQYEAKMDSAAQEVNELLAGARRDAESVKDRMLDEAREAADRERDRAVADITAAKNAALTEVAEKSADLATNLAGKIVRRELRKEDHAKLIQESLERFPSRN